MSKISFCSILFVLFIVVIHGKNCPKEGKIYETGINKNGEKEVIKAHNNYRLLIANGKVSKQPKGINLKKMVYDKNLSKKAKLVSNNCNITHVHGYDKRWKGKLGQNIFKQCSHKNTSGQNWTAAVESWFNEHKNFIYPNKTKSAHVKIGHYTQVIWANSKYIGCDFIKYYDTKPIIPSCKYVKLYICNYGPAGNIRGQSPYKTGKSGCRKLC